MTLEYRTFWIEAAADRPLRIPGHAGALLRGTFGNALRDMVCATGAPTCDGCRLATNCRYREIFFPLPPESGHALQKFSAIPAPYVLHVSDNDRLGFDAGQPLRFGVTLIGRAGQHVSLVVRALVRALATGWTRQRVELAIRAIQLQTAEGEAPLTVRDTAAPLPATDRLDGAGVVTKNPGPRRIVLRFTSPAHLRQENRTASATGLQARTVLMGLARRTSLLADFHGESPLGLDFPALAELAGQARIVSRDLAWREWRRYSARQGREMPMGGLVGQLEIEGPLQPFLPLLAFGRRLHLGKHASFGLGAYEFSPSG